MKFNETIKNRRNQLGFTQDEVAEYLHVTRQIISKWETGKSYPDLELLNALSEFYDLSLDELIKGDKQIIQFFNKESKATKNQQLANSLISLGVWAFFLILLGHSFLTQSPERVADKKWIFLFAAIINGSLFIFSVIQAISILLHKENIYIEKKKKSTAQYKFFSKFTICFAIGDLLMMTSLWLLQYDSIKLERLILCFTIGLFLSLLSGYYLIYKSKQ